jgi:formylglycine-generating enzyme required for sulfatase activity/serine/threonine protein kinase
MGSVYLARDTQLERLVALKVPRWGGDDTPSPDELMRFFREARAAAALLHPNLCPIFDVGQVDGTPYLTMAYLEGRLLSDVVERGKPLAQGRAAQIVRKLALAVQEAHAQGVIHRDLKPSNVMINPRGEPVVMDFGLARRDRTGEAPLTKAGTLLGTPAYMAPEQIRAEPEAIGPACDIYALGVILYQLVTGRLPFEGPLLSLLGQILTEDAPLPSKHRPDLEPQLEAICLKTMAKKAEDRYASMAKLAGALTEHLRNIRETPRPASGAEPAADPTPVPRAGGDSMATVVHETLLARHEPERAAATVGVPAPLPSWRSPNPEGKPQRNRPRLTRRLLLAAVGGAVALLVVGYATFEETGNGRIPINRTVPGAAVGVRPEDNLVTRGGREEPIRLPIGVVAGSSDHPASRTHSAGRGTNPPPDPAPAPIEPPSRPERPSTRREPHPAPPTSGEVARKEPEQEITKPPAPDPPSSQKVVSKSLEPAITKPPAAAPPASSEPVKKETEPKRELPPRVVEPPSLTTRVGQIPLKRIPAGTFRMGSPAGEGLSSEHPRHEVRISRPFYLGVFEVTQAQYRAVMAENPSHFARTGRDRDKVANRSTDLHPVDNVSWLDAVRFCNILSERENLEPFYEIDEETVRVPDWNGTGYRLPTEAEWEYACRAGSTTRYGFGDGEKDLSEYGWYERFAGSQTHPVGQKRPNAWGLYDMHGNVWEWCWDWYNENDSQPASIPDPTGPPQGTHRVLRGGSFHDYPAVLRSATRGRELPVNRDWVNGLRLARNSR